MHNRNSILIQFQSDMHESKWALLTQLLSNSGLATFLIECALLPCIIQNFLLLRELCTPNHPRHCIKKEI